MSYRFNFVFILFVIFILNACGSSTTGSESFSNSAAASYATFGQALDSVVPDGLKTGGANASVSPNLLRYSLSGTCADSYAECPNLTASGGGDSAAGEILSRLWAIDYNNECTSDLITSGTCFTCADCNTEDNDGINFIMPTMFSSPTSCDSLSSSEARYVNFGVDPCKFDNDISEITNITSCSSTEGSSVDISSAIPWYSSWNIPQTISFSGVDVGESMWWTVNEGDDGATQYFIRIDSDWLYGGIKNEADDYFMFLATGSPAYYVGAGEESGVNLAAYAGSITTTSPWFEAFQLRDQGSHEYVIRIKSNGSYLWYQYWTADNYPSTSDSVDSVKNSPSENRCVKISSSVVTAKYVPLTDCVTSFGKSSVSDLNADSNYQLKMIDAASVNAIAFTTPLTSDTSATCLE
jgi:hypothetical protein